MSSNTDIEELLIGLVKQIINITGDWQVKHQDKSKAVKLCDDVITKYRSEIEKLIQQKVIEARIDELEAISVSTIRQSAKSGRIGEWITIDERVKMLEAQLNHNKKGE